MILMVGGTSKIPIIQRRLREEFGRGTEGSSLVFPSGDAQLTVVKGSAIIGASLSAVGSLSIESEKMIVLEDVIPLSLGFSICLSSKNASTDCGVMDVIVAKNSQYPTRAQATYCQKEPSSSIAKLELYEGDARDVRENYLLAHLQIENIPPRDPNVCDSIIVEFIIDADGIAKIEAKVNDQSFNQTLAVVSKDGNLRAKEIAQMRREMVPWFVGHETIQKALSEEQDLM